MSSNEIKNRTVYMLSRTDGGNDIYIGSTSCPLGKRFTHHKHCAGNPSRLKYYGGSKLYKKMREFGVQHRKIVPLLTFACDRNTIAEFEQEWVKAIGADLNTVSPIDKDLVQRRNMSEYFKKNKEKKRYYCELCNVARMHNRDLKKHFGTYRHFMKWVWSVD